MRLLGVILIYGSLATLVIVSGWYGVAAIAIYALVIYLFERVLQPPEKK